MLQRKPTTKTELVKQIQTADITKIELADAADRQNAAALFRRAAFLSDKKPVAIIVLVGR